MRVPLATYRVQLGPDLTFDDVAALLPYLQHLAVLRDLLHWKPRLRRQ